MNFNQFVSTACKGFQGVITRIQDATTITYETMISVQFNFTYLEPDIVQAKKNSLPLNQISTENIYINAKF